MGQDLINFILKYLGKANSGTNDANKGQCVGLIALWVTQHNHPSIGGNAVDLLRLADPKHYKRTMNGPVNFPAPGDVVCWNGTWGGGYGHTAVVVAAGPMQLVVFEQNDPYGAAPLVATHSYGGVDGWLTMI